MAFSTSARNVVGHLAAFFEHAAVVALGLVLMVVGMGLSVTMIMLPVGLVVGLFGALLVVGGLFARAREW
jgi:hypothetical protein